MKVFLLGCSRTYKTTLAHQLEEEFGLQHVKASAWVREAIPPQLAEETAAHVERMTKYSQDQLRQDPWRSLTAMRRGYDLDRPSVIDGIRNPLDFIHLFDPRTDLAIFVKAYTTIPETSFEMGLRIIDDYLRWLEITRIGTECWDTIYVTGNTSDDITKSLACGLKRIQPRIRALLDKRTMSTSTAPTSTTSTSTSLPGSQLTQFTPPPVAAVIVHASIPPFQTFVREEYLYDLDPKYVGNLLPCKVFAVSSYPDEAITFQIRLNNGSVFSYIPPTGLGPRTPRFSLEDLVYFNCPSGEIVVQHYQELDGHVSAFFRRLNVWEEGTYLFTIDWWRQNQTAHVVRLADGQIAVLPQHKLKFRSGERSFEPYKKLRQVWKIRE